MIDCTEEEKKLIGEDELDDFGEDAEEDTLLESRHDHLKSPVESTKETTLDGPHATSDSSLPKPAKPKKEEPKTLDSERKGKAVLSAQRTNTKKKQKLVMFIGQTRYPVVKQVAKKVFGMRTTQNEEEEWDICWTDNSVQAERLYRMKPY